MEVTEVEVAVISEKGSGQGEALFVRMRMLCFFRRLVRCRLECSGT
jgi:hypothetical protein